MITLITFSIMNGLVFHCSPNTITEEIRIIISVICVASDLNIIATLGSKHISGKEQNG